MIIVPFWGEADSYPSGPAGAAHIRVRVVRMGRCRRGAHTAPGLPAWRRSGIRTPAGARMVCPAPPRPAPPHHVGGGPQTPGADTVWGVDASVVLPSPSSLLTSVPQHSTPPTVDSAQLLESLSLTTAVAIVPGANHTGTGLVEVPKVPFPSSPSGSSPQQTAVPVVSTAQKDWASALSVTADVRPETGSGMSVLPPNGVVDLTPPDSSPERANDQRIYLSPMQPAARIQLCTTFW